MTSPPQHIKEIMFGDKWKYNELQRGFTIVEILVVIAVITTAFTSILGFFALDARISDRNRMHLNALSLAEEAIEAVRYFRDNTSWPTGLGGLAIGTDYHPVVNGSMWDIILGSENINGFNRKIVVDSVSRDVNDNIESIYNPVNYDADTRKITITVSWTDRFGSTSENLITYLTNWK